MYLKFYNKDNGPGDKRQNGGYLWGGRPLTGKGHEKMSRGKTDVLYLNLSVRYIGICRS